MTTRIGWIVAAAIALVLLVAGAVTALVVAGGDPTSVEQVADAAVDAAEDLDVDEGADLMCEAPSAEDRADLTDLIGEAQEEADTETPEVDYEVSEIEGDAAGSFVVRITSSEEGLDDEELELRVLVEQRGDRSCITGVEALD